MMIGGLDTKIEEIKEPEIGIKSAKRQSIIVVIQAINGTKSSCPAANAAVRTPTTKPRLFTNHLDATVAVRPKPIMPEAEPKNTPIAIKKCQVSKEIIHNPKPTILSPMAVRTTGVTPKFNISAPLKGARHASVKNMRPIAFEISEICHPYSSVIGRIIS